MSATLTVPNSWRASLEGLGFERAEDGPWFRQNGLAVRIDRRWLTATQAVDEATDPLAGQLGRPGLWKVVPHDGGLRREFHLPLSILSAAVSEEEEAGDALESCLAWIGASALDDVPAGWEGPLRSEVEQWLPEGGLTVEAKPSPAQGTLISDEGRLALRMPIVAEIGAGLSEARRAWIREALLDAQARWRMVRVGLEGPADRPAAVGEVDLSGAPPAVLQALVSVSLEGLRWVSGWAIGSAGLLADARVGCRLWEIGPERA